MLPVLLSPMGLETAESSFKISLSSESVSRDCDNLPFCPSEASNDFAFDRSSFLP